jgi:hypothetical protein
VNTSTPANILARIRKLSAMTIANGCSEAEAQFAMEKVQQLMDEYQPTEQELRATARQCATDELVTMDDNHTDWSFIVTTAARYWGCKSWMSTRHEDLLGLGLPQKFHIFRFFGLPNDAAAAQVMTAMCFTAIQTESTAFAKALSKKQRAGDRAHAVRSFRMGMATRLSDRIQSMKAKRPVQATGQALTVLKDQLVTEEFAKLGLRLRTYRTRASASVNSAAFAAGYARGGSTQLDPSNSIGRGALALPSK